MKTKEEILKPIAYKFGAFLGLIIIASLFIGTLIDQTVLLSIASFLLTVLIFVFGIQKFKTNNSNKISLVNSIKIGLAIAAIGAVIGCFYTYIHLNYLTEKTISNDYNYVMLFIRTLSVGLVISVITGLVIKNE